MLKNLIIKEVKKLLYKAICKHAEIIGGDEKETFLYIKAINNEGDPGLKIWNPNIKVFKNIEFNDITIFAKLGLGAVVKFDIENELPIWIKKFILKSCVDEGINITEPYYIIRTLDKNDVMAMMKMEDKPYKTVSIDYILTTK